MQIDKIFVYLLSTLIVFKCCYTCTLRQGLWFDSSYIIYLRDYEYYEEGGLNRSVKSGWLLYAFITPTTQTHNTYLLEYNTRPS